MSYINSMFDDYKDYLKDNEGVDPDFPEFDIKFD